MNGKLRSLILILALAVGPAAGLTSLPSQSLAETNIVFAKHKTVMGDNDSRNDARQICFLEAKRRVLEKAGTYIESYTSVENFRLTKDEISTYAAALLKVEIVKEEWKLEGESLAVVMNVKATVDADYVEKQISKIKRDVSLAKSLKEQQQKMDELEKKIAVLQRELESASQATALPLRKKRLDALEDIDRIETRYKYTRKSVHNRKAASRTQLKNILNYIELGMTPMEVKYILGKPTEIINLGSTIYYYRYGSISIGFTQYGENVVQAITWLPSTCNKLVYLKYHGYNIQKNGMLQSQEQCKREIEQNILFNNIQINN